MSRSGLLVGLAGVAAAILLITRFVSAPSEAGPEPKKENTHSLEINNLNLQKWHEFTAPSKEFKVLFPTLPQHAKERLEDPKTKSPRQYEMFVSEKEDGTIFMISQITLLEAPKEEPDEKMLSNIMNEMLAASPESKLKVMNMTKYQGHPALDFSIDNQQINIDGKVFIVGHTLYLLSSISKLVNYKAQEFEFFVNSFQLLSEGFSSGSSASTVAPARPATIPAGSTGLAPPATGSLTPVQTSPKIEAVPVK